MLYCILVIISALCYAVQFALNKVYQSRKGSAVNISLKFIAVKGAAAAAVFFVASWIIYGKPLCFYPASVILAFMASVFGCACWILGFIIFRYGNGSVFSAFLMIGGMTLPSIYSALRGENLGVLQTIGIVLLILSLFLPFLGKCRKRAEGGNRIIFVLLCVAVFICNGCMSIISSIHSGNDFLPFVQSTIARIYPSVSLSRVNGMEFTVLVNLFNSIICSSALFITFMVSRTKKSVIRAESESDSKLESVGCSSRQRATLGLIIIGCAVLDALAFVIMRAVDVSGEIASVKYPLQTACTVILSAVAGYVFFKEKPSRLEVLGLAMTFVCAVLFMI